MNYEMSLSKFMKAYYGIPNSKTKYLRHKDFIKIMPHLSCTPTSEDELNENIRIGKFIFG